MGNKIDGGGIELSIAYVLQKPVAILLILLATLLCFSTTSFASHRTQDVQEMAIDRDAARAKAAFFFTAAVVLLAVAVAAAPVSGGTSIVAYTALVGAISAGAGGVTYQMEANKLDRRVKAWSSY